MNEEPERFRQIKDVFQTALELAGEERLAFLEQACRGDSDLRSRVENLLAADEDTGSLLEEGASDLTARLLSRPSQGAERIGPHRLLREIGRGGMGTIYLAVRDDGQFQQEVAIKLVQGAYGGLESSAALNRFRRERQILADLHHPNIARLLDGGVTDQGLPYFVMEYIEGDVLTRYCEAHELSAAQRIELFRTICGAVQAAHRSLVVHCDLKPSNILVTAEGVPKLLDFGIARLLDVRDDSADPLTVAPRPMTPAYACPEQVRGQALTTASDVYSLGVVLYELLTGRRPYEIDGLSGYEIERVICEQEPDKPSVVSRRRLAGELDTIVLKALAKEPEQRYGSADQLAEDLKRHLEGLPVLARRPTLAYRSAKFLRRHRLGVAASLLLLASLVGGIVSTAHQARVAEQRGRTAERELEFLIDLFESADPEDSKFGTLTLRDMLDMGAESIGSELVDEPLAQAALKDAMGEVYRKLGDHDVAEALIVPALETRRRLLDRGHADLATSLHHLGSLRFDQARFEEARQLLAEALALRESLEGGESLKVADSVNDLALVMGRQGLFEQAEVLHRRALGIRRRLLGEPHLKVSTSLNNLAGIYLAQGRLEEAEELYREVLDMRRQLLGDEHPRVATSLNNLARMLARRKHYEESKTLYLEALDLRRKLLGRHHRVAETLNNLGVTCYRMKDYDQARTFFSEALAIYREQLGEDHPQVAEAMDSLAATLLKLDRDRDAEALLREALAFYRRRGIANDSESVPTLHRLGGLLLARGESSEAEALLRQALSILEATDPESSRAEEVRDGLAKLEAARSR